MESAPNPVLTSEMIAKAIYDGLRRHPRMLVQGEPALGERTLIDGEFHLTRVARRVIAVIEGAEHRDH